MSKSPSEETIKRVMSELGKRRSAKLTPARRQEIARAAIKARWDKYRARIAAAK